MRLTLPLLLCLPATLAAQDEKPLPPREAVKRITVPEGFRVRLYVGEPDVLNPIAMTLDDLGRLWVVESHSYPHWIKDGKPGKDRVLIFEGMKEDGSFAKCHVFLDNGTNLSGIAIGHSGVWLISLPKLIFIPCKAGANAPEGPAKTLVDGFVVDVKHNAANNLQWGPDGWLYGCHGILADSLLGVPGTPPEKRFRINCGVWRYHPVKKIVEPYAWGTTNPWGLDWDDYGEMFITNCVIKHVFHVVPGAHFVRMYGNDLNPYTFDLMESCADHTHWAGGSWTDSRGAKGAHDEAGGGHAHVGAMVYLSDTWPKEYRGQLFMGNLHGARINMDCLERKGSGYVSHRGFDPFMAHDPWFRPITVLQAPDGNVFISDWNDTGECHNYDKTYPSGRIYRMEYVKGTKPLEKFNIATMTDEELVKLQLHENDWWVRRARLQIQERAARGDWLKKATPVAIEEDLELTLKMLTDADVRRALRGLWLMNASGMLDRGPELLLRLATNPDDRRFRDEMRVWAMRLLTDSGATGPETRKRLEQCASSPKRPVLRLGVASALQHLPLEDRVSIAEKLLAHAEDWNDPNLPFMYWYGIEPAVAKIPDAGPRLLRACKIPIVRLYISRRMAMEGEGSEAMALLLKSLEGTTKDEETKDILRGMHIAFLGRRDVKAPAAWPALQVKLMASKDDEISEKATLLGVVFGDKEALASLRKQASDAGLKADKRRRALQGLVQVKAGDLLPLLATLLGEPDMREPALQALAGQKDAAVPGLILKHYADFKTKERETAVATLSSRADFALALLDAVEKKTVPRGDISAFAARQIQSLKDKKVSDRLTAVWGTLRPTAGAKRELLTKYLAVAAPDALKKADRKLGHALFTKHCANCHTLFGEGGKIGPELTGSQRQNPEYVLSKILDPSAVVNKDYQMVLLSLDDGRTLTGIVKEENDKTLALQTATELIRVNKADIAARKVTGLSLMPEGLLQTLSDPEVRALIAYLGADGPLKDR